MGDLGIIIVNTELNDKNSCYQLIITITIFEKTNTFRKMSPMETMSKVKIFLHFGNSPVFPGISGCRYGYFDQFCYW